MVKAFLFDYDGVMTAGAKEDGPDIRLAEKLGVPLERATEWIASIWLPYTAGQLSDDEMWKIIEEKYQQPIPPEQRDIWYGWEELTPLPEMVNLVRELRRGGYKVGLVSNIIPVTARLIRERGGYDGFDFVILSCDVGTRKPEEQMYRIALAQLDGIAPEEILFLDDRDFCVEAASKLGLQTMLVTNHDEAIAEIRGIVASQQS